MNLPNKLSVFRIILMPCFVAMYFFSFVPYNHLIATFIFLIATFTDFLDGYIARKYNLITDLGKFLDPIADKIIVGAALFLIVAFFETFTIICVICAIIIISREFVISTFRIIAASKNVVLAADIFGKIKTVIQFVSIIVLLPIQDFDYKVLEYIGISFLFLGTLFATISMINYIYRNKGVLNL